MSIAVSAKIAPSRFFMVCTFGMAAMMVLTGFLIVSGQTGTFDLFSRMIVTVICFVSAGFFIFLHFRSKKSFWIDISGSGQIRIREDVRNVSVQNFRQEQTVPDAEVFYMVNGSTIWPILLLLHVEFDSKQRKFITIFSDSVNEEALKALYIACQWLVVHQNEKQ